MYIMIINLCHTEQNERYSAYDIFKRIVMNEKFCILIRISLKFVLKGPNCQ